MYLGLELPVKDKKQIRRAKNLPDLRLFLWSYICHGSSFNSRVFFVRFDGLYGFLFVRMPKLQRV